MKDTENNNNKNLTLFLLGLIHSGWRWVVVVPLFLSRSWQKNRTVRVLLCSHCALWFCDDPFYLFICNIIKWPLWHSPTLPYGPMTVSGYVLELLFAICFVISLSWFSWQHGFSQSLVYLLASRLGCQHTLVKSSQLYLFSLFYKVKYTL